MNFSEALEEIKKGKCLSREGWNGKGLFVCAQIPDQNSKMKKPYLFMNPPDGNFVPWVPSQTDLFGNDWYVVEVIV